MKHIDLTSCYFIMKRCYIIASILILSVLSFSSLIAQNTEQNYVIEVTISGIEEMKGKLRIAVYNSENEFPSETDIMDFIVVEAKKDNQKIQFTVSSKGKYAIAMLHDVSNNGKMDFNFVGFPKEPYGFSMNPGIWHRRPTFDECSFMVEGPTNLVINL